MPAQGHHRTDGVREITATAADNDEVNDDSALGEKSRQAVCQKRFDPDPETSAQNLMQLRETSLKGMELGLTR